MQRKDLFLEHVVEVAATTLSILGSRENCAGDRSQCLVGATQGTLEILCTLPAKVVFLTSLVCGGIRFVPPMSFTLICP